MYKVKFYEEDKNLGCSHQVVIASKTKNLDYHSSSPLHRGVCLQCKLSQVWEIRHLDYVVVGCNNPDIKNKYYVNFTDLFNYNEEYTEKEVVEKLVSTYRPDYIMNGRRCLYTLENGINDEVLWK